MPTQFTSRIGTTARALAALMVPAVVLFLSPTGAPDGRADTGVPESFNPGLVWCAVFSPDGRTMATSGGDPFHGFKPGEAILWDLAKGKERATLTGHRNPVEFIAFAPDGKTVATGSHDWTVKLWAPATGKERQTLAGHVAG